MSNEYYSKYKESIKKATRKYLENNPEYRLYHIAKQRAKKRNIEFSISIEDIKIPERCPYLGIELTTLLGQGRLPFNASIDRKDPTKGYTPDNIEIISDLANRMKTNATTEQLIIFAKAVLKRHNA